MSPTDETPHDVARTIPVFPPGTINKRPENVISLLIERDIDGGWFTHASGKNRFFIVNLDTALSQIGFNQHTKAKDYFDKAARIIATVTKWKEQYPFDYKCHPRHISRDKRRLPKYFGHAATMIVAAEVMAAELKPAVNVYDLLRILPAQYFVDLLDVERMQELQTAYDAMTPDEKGAKFGSENADLSFVRQCLKAIRQPASDELLDEIVDGDCVTKFTAERLMAFVNENFHKDLHVGPVLVSGMDASSRGLGTGPAAKSLRVPKTMTDIPPCP